MFEVDILYFTICVGPVEKKFGKRVTRANTYNTRQLQIAGIVSQQWRGNYNNQPGAISSRQPTAHFNLGQFIAGCPFNP